MALLKSFSEKLVKVEKFVVRKDLTYLYSEQNPFCLPCIRDINGIYRRLYGDQHFFSEQIVSVPFYIGVGQRNFLETYKSNIPDRIRLKLSKCFRNWIYLSCDSTSVVDLRLWSVKKWHVYTWSNMTNVLYVCGRWRSDTSILEVVWRTSFYVLPSQYISTEKHQFLFCFNNFRFKWVYRRRTQT